MRKVFGIHNAFSMIRYKTREVVSIDLSESRNDRRIRQIEKLATEQGIPVRRIASEVMNEASEGVRHQGVILTCRSEKLRPSANLNDWFNSLKNQSLLIVLDSVTDPRNLGACIRSANSAGADGVIVSRSRGSPLTATVSHTAAGAAEVTNLYQASNLARDLENLKKNGIWVIGLDTETSDPIFASDLTHPCALVFGAEDRGLRAETKKKCDSLISIPMLGDVQSVNVSVAVGIAAFEVVRQRMHAEADG
ncbi:MAG: 23S rRNA (guanosine(2251)-2'-O)-methyltransferase RlmB [Acidiferrobacterales bacterium]|nr:23S rRNA (guanosine(2251)-2'-O)-methyltransferase RlmB [Acidiferrobacterales bacterium]